MAGSKSKWKTWLKWLVLGFLVLVLALFVTLKALSKPRPEVVSSPAADALARKMLLAVNDEAWQKTGAVRWIFANRHEHLWDRHRHLARVRWSNHEVLVNLHSRKGLAFRNGVQLSGDGAQKLVDKAWAYWANDSFWLNPVSKAFDEGVSRGLVDTGEAQPGLLVSYGSGGVTPGDAYLWHLDEQGLPQCWQMWVSIIPVGGIEATWEEWETLATGAKVSKKHQTPLFELRLFDIEAAFTLSELETGPDPFAKLVNP